MKHIWLALGKGSVLQGWSHYLSPFLFFKFRYFWLTILMSVFIQPFLFRVSISLSSLLAWEGFFVGGAKEKDDLHDTHAKNKTQDLFWDKRFPWFSACAVKPKVAVVDSMLGVTGKRSSSCCLEMHFKMLRYVQSVRWMSQTTHAFISVSIVLLDKMDALTFDICCYRES